MNTAVADKKTISITEKRQMTIPRKFYDALGFGGEAECILRGDELVIRPVVPGGEFAEQILADLVAEGYSGNELLERFRAARHNVRPAVEKMLNEAKSAARGESKAYDSKDVFGD